MSDDQLMIAGICLYVIGVLGLGAWLIGGLPDLMMAVLHVYSQAPK